MCTDAEIETDFLISSLLGCFTLILTIEGLQNLGIFGGKLGFGYYFVLPSPQKQTINFLLELKIIWGHLLLLLFV